MKHIKKFNESNFEESPSQSINIPEEFESLIGYYGSNTAHPEDIIDMYNDIVSPGDFGDIPQLVSYQNGNFHNEDGDSIPENVILDELNYGLSAGDGEM